MTPHAAPVEAPTPAPRVEARAVSFFVERESLELKQLQSFLESESPACEVVLACDVAQAAALAGLRKGRGRVVVIHGGLADGRAQALVERLREQRGLLEYVAFVDRRHCRGELAEAARPEVLHPGLRGALTDGWLFVRFLDRRP